MNKKNTGPDVITTIELEDIINAGDTAFVRTCEPSQVHTGHYSHKKRGKHGKEAQVPIYVYRYIVSYFRVYKEGSRWVWHKLAGTFVSSETPPLFYSHLVVGLENRIYNAPLYVADYPIGSVVDNAHCNDGIKAAAALVISKMSDEQRARWTELLERTLAQYE